MECCYHLYIYSLTFILLFLAIVNIRGGIECITFTVSTSIQMSTYVCICIYGCVCVWKKIKQNEKTKISFTNIYLCIFLFVYFCMVNWYMCARMCYCVCVCVYFNLFSMLQQCKIKQMWTKVVKLTLRILNWPSR